MIQMTSALCQETLHEGTAVLKPVLSDKAEPS